jgi:hypothetical protein
MREILSKYLPIEIIPLVESIIKENKIYLTITPNRKSKAGDYRSPHKGKGHRISINGSLNKYAFTITFFHEYAHLLVWEKYKNKVLPHGNEWKTVFSRMLQKLLKNKIFPGKLAVVVENYALNPKASSYSDISLSRELSKYDKKTIFMKSLLDIDTGKKFKLENGRTFVKGNMKRTRIWCKEANTNAIYAFNPNIEVIEL